MNPHQAVIDVSVIIDACDPASHNHAASKELIIRIRDTGLECVMPMHGLFELSCASRRSKTLHWRGLQALLPEDKPLNFSPVPIDEKFVNTYLDPSLPAIRAGDFVYLAVAVKMKLRLVTNDITFLKAAKQCHSQSYSASEALAHF